MRSPEVGCQEQGQRLRERQRLLLAPITCVTALITAM
jgi:hypothetical protein